MGIVILRFVCFSSKASFWWLFSMSWPGVSPMGLTHNYFSIKALLLNYRPNSLPITFLVIFQRTRRETALSSTCRPDLRLWIYCPLIIIVSKTHFQRVFNKLLIIHTGTEFTLWYRVFHTSCRIFQNIVNG